MLSFLCRVSHLIYCNAECHYATCHGTLLKTLHKRGRYSFFATAVSYLCKIFVKSTGGVNAKNLFFHRHCIFGRVS
jgi:hypothetical protein